MYMHLSNIENIYTSIKKNQGFDAVVVVSTSESQARFWKRRLEKSKKEVCGEKTRIFSLVEDWPGGAGQLLGTLYAWGKADGLEEILKKDGTVAIYHTAGKGTRMAHVPLAESGNKSAVKLPRRLPIENNSLMTLLEGVIFQTSIFAGSRKGRLCVFWEIRSSYLLMLRTLRKTFPEKSLPFGKKFPKIKKNG